MLSARTAGNARTGTPAENLWAWLLVPGLPTVKPDIPVIEVRDELSTTRIYEVYPLQ